MAVHEHGTPSVITDVGDDGFCDVCRPKHLPLGYSAKELYEIPPNRFDPYEALDTILNAVARLGFGPGHSVGDRILTNLYAIRAYITGIEKRR